MLRRNFLSMIPPGLMSLFAVGEQKTKFTKSEKIWVTYIQNVYSFTQGLSCDENMMRSIEEQVDITDIFYFRDKLITFVYDCGLNVSKLGLPEKSGNNIVYELYARVRKINNRLIYETTEKILDIIGRTDITEIIAPNATYAYCRDCKLLTKLELPVALTVHCYGCTQLTELGAPVASTVCCDGCPRLKLKLPVADYVYCNGLLNRRKLEHD